MKEHPITRRLPGDQGGLADILRLIRSGTATTRAELIEQTGLSRSTVSQRLSTLMESELVVGVGEASSTGGRPATLLSFNGSAGVVLTAVLGATSSRVAVVDLGGRVLAERAEDRLISDGPTATLEAITAEFRDLLGQTETKEENVWGVGIGVPGPVEFASGRPISPPIMPGWDNFPVGAWLTEQLGCPALVDNDVNMMALGERFLRWSSSGQFIFIKVGTGIGAGIIADGHLYRGAQGSAGDIGHINVPGHDDVVCECGNTGCLEAVAGGRALTRRLAEAGLPVADARDVVEQVRGGNTAAIQAVRAAGRDIGSVLAMLVNAFNPSTIAIGGALSAAGDHLLAGVREVVYQRSPPLATRNLNILSTEPDNQIGVIGAAVMLTEKFLVPAGPLPG